MRFTLPILAPLLLLSVTGYTQKNTQDSLQLFTGIVYDTHFKPVPYTHVISLSTGYGDITDTLGIFVLKVIPGDELRFRNISYVDTIVAIDPSMKSFYVKLRDKRYLLRGARIFDWGSTYQEMLSAFRKREQASTMGEKLGLPRQDPDHIPFEMNEKLIRSPGFLLTSPVSYFYYNLSQRAKNARKAYQLESNAEKISKFNQLLSPGNVSEITGFKGDDLQDFMLYLNENMNCDYSCSELQILTELHLIFDRYQSGNEEK